MTTLKNTFGIAARNFTAYPEMPDALALTEYGVKMEELGFDSIWVWDHILLGVDPNFPIVDSLTFSQRLQREQNVSSCPPVFWYYHYAIRYYLPSSSPRSINSRGGGC